MKSLAERGSKHVKKKKPIEIAFSMTLYLKTLIAKAKVLINSKMQFENMGIILNSPETESASIPCTCVHEIFMVIV